MRLATPVQMRAIDAAAVGFGLPAELLMEAAGTLAAAEVAAHPGVVAVLCGPGLNGADGLVVARHLAARGRSVRVSTFGQSKSDLYRAQLDRLRAAGVTPGPVELGRAGVIVDALFGVSFRGDLADDVARVVRATNAADAHRVALDLPSGLDGRTGRAAAAFAAHQTLTFGLAKPGLFTGDGPAHAGRVTVLPIGCPHSLVETMANTHELFDAAGITAPFRAPGANKTHFGHALVIAGRANTWGAGALAAEAAFRAGAGYVTWASHEPPVEALRRAPEVMTARAADDHAWSRATAIAIGPGLGADELTRDAIARARASGKPAVLDADALTACAKFGLLPLPAHWIITPHAGELARLIDRDARAIEADRFDALARAVERAGCVVLLKGFRTVVGTGARVRVIHAGNAALAKAGTGDVLTGLVVGLLARGFEPFDAAATAAYLHGRVADEWIVDRDPASLRASDVLDALPELMARVAR